MKKGIRIAFELAWLMLEWADKRGLYSRVDVHTYAVEFSSQMESFRNVHLFKKAFPKAGILKRDTSKGELTYKGKIENLNLYFYSIGTLPPSCELITEEVTIPEELILEHTKPEHVETVTKIVCGNGEKTEETEALLNEN